ncbi:predicted protein [Sclerotinia sclerotiorum 1980 UF-70]|uniref:Uncharacterized protein n=1 Tax=Sclerotinia sclerotiorum (strain ATCC 18683 / 1980 / Ss-1) TaxID=665079 RepID=A7EEC9_SCLS1|nr:predicted protein [Sclerotinia sclerotiorum 1980 UF-70]EDO01195.1 predicted protein [Sclerotinia sclerotiorum 1980 UF-70]
MTKNSQPVKHILVWEFFPNYPLKLCMDTFGGAESSGDMSDPSFAKRAWG